MNEILKKIIFDKKIQVEKNKKISNINLLMQKVKLDKNKRNFAETLKIAQKNKETAVIAEIKYKSPTQTKLNSNLKPEIIAQKYQNAGAKALSILTDEKYFGGSIEFLKRVRKVSSLPILQKDFIIDNYQIIEAKAQGADAILLIMAALDDNQAQELETTAKQYQLDVIIEIHSAQELQRVYQNMKGEIIGINNRNLKSFEVSIDNSVKISKNITKPQYTIISESGINNSADIKFLQNSGIYCFLIGKTLMQSKDPEQQLQTLLDKRN